MKSPYLIYFSCRWHAHVYIIWHRIEGLIVKTPSTKKDILYAIFLYRKRCSVLFSHLLSLFVGIHLSSMPPKNYWYQNKLQKPRVLGCSRPILWSLPSKPLRWRGQGCSAGSKLALPALPQDLQLQFLPAARRAVCDRGPRVSSQIPWLWECARLLEKSETGIRNASIAFGRSTLRLLLQRSS